MHFFRGPFFNFLKSTQHLFHWPRFTQYHNDIRRQEDRIRTVFFLRICLWDGNAERTIAGGEKSFCSRRFVGRKRVFHESGHSLGGTRTLKGGLLSLSPRLHLLFHLFFVLFFPFFSVLFPCTCVHRVNTQGPILHFFFSPNFPPLGKILCHRLQKMGIQEAGRCEHWGSFPHFLFLQQTIFLFVLRIGTTLLCGAPGPPISPKDVETSFASQESKVKKETKPIQYGQTAPGPMPPCVHGPVARPYRKGTLPRPAH
mmetsp:Transcript_26680/g.68501  ORF Transcript_26680/g.68501 Transcript_26680/m.68501 type:complete len:256 (+) Transcript_26680:523-1290(+)